MAERRLLAHRAAALGLTAWHLAAARILYTIHGVDTALAFLAQCAGTHGGEAFQVQEVRH